MNTPAGSAITKVADNLYLISLYPGLPGFEDFISAWLYRRDRTYLVDVGPAVSIPQLLSALSGLHVTGLDAILLTHIHLDHAGGIGEMAAAFPDTPIVCHPEAVSHLADPSRLWAGSLKVLGDVAEAYQEVKPVPASVIHTLDEWNTDETVALATPGHAPHHASYYLEPYLFAGEAAGVNLSLPDGGIYMRPGTPPKFVFETFLKSLDALIDLNPDTICYGHFGMQPDGGKWLSRHREQLFLWKHIIDQERKTAGPVGTPTPDILNRCEKRLSAEDRYLECRSSFPAETLRREAFFMGNCIKGFWEDR